MEDQSPVQEGWGAERWRTGTSRTFTPGIVAVVDEGQECARPEFGSVRCRSRAITALDLGHSAAHHAQLSLATRV